MQNTERTYNGVMVRPLDRDALHGFGHGTIHMRTSAWPKAGVGISPSNRLQFPSGRPHDLLA